MEVDEASLGLGDDLLCDDEDVAFGKLGAALLERIDDHRGQVVAGMHLRHAFDGNDADFSG